MKRITDNVHLDEKWCGCSNSWDANLCDCQCHEGPHCCDKGRIIRAEAKSRREVR